jgi:hypothetical protein
MLLGIQILNGPASPPSVVDFSLMKSVPTISLVARYFVLPRTK